MEYEGTVREGRIRDTPCAYLPLRREIITKQCESLSLAEVNTLAERTRGMRQDDIEKAVTGYVKMAGCRPFQTILQIRVIRFGGTGVNGSSIRLCGGKLSKIGFQPRILAGHYGSVPCRSNSQEMRENGCQCIRFPFQAKWVCVSRLITASSPSGDAVVNAAARS